MIYVALLALYFVYHIVIINHVAYVVDCKNKLKNFIAITGVINAFIFTAIYILKPTGTDIGLIVTFVAVYLIECTILTGRNIRIMLFGILSYTINLFSRRILTQVVFALIFDITMAECYANSDIYFWISAIPLLLSAPHIYVTMKFLKREYLDMIFTDKKNLMFTIYIMGTVTLFLAFSLALININEAHTNYIWMYLFVGLTAAVSYYLANMYAYTFSKLKLHVIKYEEISQNVKKETERIETLSEQAQVDDFTGVKTRSVAIETIENYIERKRAFYTIFIDMDGLKIVNDKYGHAEGDVYILSVSNIIKEIYGTETISRMGGDEFLIVGDTGDEFIATSKTMQVYQRVKEIKYSYNKEYDTSVSYGIVYTYSHNSKTAKQIIDEADKKMYEFKKSKKRERKK